MFGAVAIGWFGLTYVFCLMEFLINTPDNITGRVFSVSTLVGNVSLPIAYGIFGILLTYNSIMKLMFFSGACLILLCLSLIFKLKINKMETVKN